jgi:hypothetical protein
MKWAEAAALDLIDEAIQPGGRLIRRPRASPVARPDATVELAAGARIDLELKRWGTRLSEPPRDTAIVWVLERSRPELRQRLREADENFVDPAGWVRLHLPGLLVDRSDLERVSRPPGAETRNPFADRASRIPRTLFASASDRTWSIQELAAAADVSLGTTSYAVTALADRDLVEVSAVGKEKRVRLRDRRTLVLQWCAEYSWRRNTAVAFDAPVGSPLRFLERLPDLLRMDRWALGLQAGATLVNPHAKWDTVHIYMRERTAEELHVVGNELGWHAADSGKVVLLAPYYTDSVWFGIREIDGLPVVSDLQLILDLWHYPVRGREQAEMLLEHSMVTQS